MTMCGMRAKGVSGRDLVAETGLPLDAARLHAYSARAAMNRAGRQQSKSPTRLAHADLCSRGLLHFRGKDEPSQFGARSRDVRCELAVDQNVATSLGMPLYCAAFDCYGWFAQTP